MSRADVPVSVLLPVHDGISVRALSDCLDSIRCQTVTPAEVVLVEDGPLRAELRAVLDGFASGQDMAVVRIALERNGGAGVANDAGLRAASQPWIAKADADDISLPQRLAAQWAAVSDGSVDVCGAAMWEFENEPDDIVGVRTMPADDAAIRRRMRANNPINHPTALYRRDLALAAGGYGSMRFMQDYDLFARMSVAGARMTNLPEPLVLFRSGDAVHSRRRWSPAMAEAERLLQANLRRYGVVGGPRSKFNLAWRTAYRRLPPSLLAVVHRRWLSRPLPVAGPEAGPTTWGRVRHQVRLMGRSARTVVREPATGREVGRLLATRGRSTSRLRLPWLPFRLIDELAAHVGPGSRVFEYGGGGSTLWFLDRGCHVVTVEHVPAWSERLRSLVTSARWELLECPADDGYDAYVAAIEGFPEESFDVVVVDGRERVRCAHAALSRVRPGGLLIVDDVDRVRYAAGLASIPWPRRDVVGFAPAKPSLAYSAVFTRPQQDD